MPFKKQKTEPSEPYQAEWQADLHPEMVAFHQKWFGPTSEGACELQKALSSTTHDRDRFVKVSQEYVWRELNLLEVFSGWLYVRAEYRGFYARLSQAHRDLEPRGIVVIGQPGIGKSYFAVFALLSQMASHNTVMFTTSTSTTYIFDSDGVWRTPTDRLVTSHLPLTRIWSIIDAGVDKKPVPATLTAYPSFPVLTTSPQEIRYKEFIKKYKVRVWIMESWTSSELHTLLSIHQSDISITDVQNYVATCGPVPRDIIDYRDDERLFCSAIEGAIDMYRGDIAVAFQSQRLNINEMSSKLLLLRRGSLPRSASDQALVHFKTPSVGAALLARLEFNELEEARKHFRACNGMRPQGGAMAGWLFEGIAIKYTSSLPAHPDLCAFALMCFVAADSTDFPNAFIHASTSPDVSLQVNTNGRITRSVTRAMLTAATAGSYTALPVRSRRIITYNNLEEDITVNDANFYRPAKFNSPGFDSFFFEVLENKVIVWMLQMTIRKEHDGKSSGFDMVRAIRTIASTKATNIEIKYVLVVPQHKSDTVRWDMAPDYNEPELTGEVYVQKIDVALLGCDPDLVLDFASGKGDSLYHELLLS